MVLVDKNIRSLVSEKKLIIENYHPDRLNGVSYDLGVDTITDSKGEEHINYEIEPGETVIVKTQEKFAIPDNLIGDVIEKNSRMRQGLRVDAPRYQPGHVTFGFLRVQNISEATITLCRGSVIAQIYFEELKEIPDVTYDMQEKASFNNEESYIGFGNYTKLYEQQIAKKKKDARDELDGIANKMYANILSLMGILVAIISMISINANAFSETSIDFKFIIIMNLTLAISIAVLMGIILIFINKADNKKFLLAYIIIIIVLILVLLGVCLL